MNQKLQRRVITAYENFDKLERLRSVVEAVEGTSPRDVITSAALLGAEVIATAAGKGADSSLIHRMYEELVEAAVNSPSVNEAFSSVRTAEAQSMNQISAVQRAVSDFRAFLVTGDTDNV